MKPLEWLGGIVEAVFSPLVRTPHRPEPEPTQALASPRFEKAANIIIEFLDCPYHAVGVCGDTIEVQLDRTNVSFQQLQELSRLLQTTNIGFSPGYHESAWSEYTPSYTEHSKLYIRDWLLGLDVPDPELLDKMVSELWRPE